MSSLFLDEIIVNVTEFSQKVVKGENVLAINWTNFLTCNHLHALFHLLIYNDDINYHIIYFLISISFLLAGGCDALPERLRSKQTDPRQHFNRP